MWWQDDTGKNYYSRKKRDESYYPNLKKDQLIKEVKGSPNLSSYQKKQLLTAIKKGLGIYIEKYWDKYQTKHISQQKLILEVNKTLIEKEITDDKIYFSSTDDFFNTF